MSLRHLKRWVALSITMMIGVAGPGAMNFALAQKPKTEPAKKGDKPGKPDATQPNVSMEIAKAEGKYAAYAQGVIKILNAENQEIFLHSQSDTVVRYTAEAEPSWLMPGYMVRFSATFDEKGKPTGTLKAIEVFTPSMRRRLSPAETREQTAGIHMEDKGQPEGAKDLFTEKSKKPQPSARPKKGAIVPGQTFRVVGQLVGVQNNVLNINANVLVQIEIDPTATVSVTADDLNAIGPMIAQGDQITVSGLRNPAQPTQIYCETILIKASKKLSQAMPQAKKGKSSARDKDKDKDKDDPKGAKDAKDKVDSKKPNASDKKL